MADDLTYCPFRKFGCEAVGVPFSEDFLEHTNRKCGFRYSICCFIPGCNNENLPVFAGYFQDHLIGFHGIPMAQIELEGHKDFTVYLNLTSSIMDEMSIPLLLFDPKKPGMMFPFVMKRSGDFVYIWIYQIMDRDIRQEKCLGVATIFPRYIGPHPPANDEPLLGNDIIHDIWVPIEEVIKSERVIKVPFYDFADKHISNYQEIGADGKEEERYLYHFDVVIYTTAETEYANVAHAIAQQDLEEEARLAREEAAMNKALKQREEEMELEKVEEDRRQARKYATSLFSLPYSIENVALQRRRLNEFKKP